ncbi:MAG: transketolase [Gammaproteobacteria bacterium GWE2_37_16]|nr:MAG: transketolase [Gammaproteobacteria bacterium GWE2_37_16]
MISEKLAQKVRKHVVEMTSRGNSSHVGSALSITDLLAVLYGKILCFDPGNPKWEKRDRFLLSKGHAGAAVYAILAEVGFFSTEILQTHYQNGSILSGHVSHKDVPGVEFSTGSLGHALSVGVGMAYNAKLKGENHRVFVLMSDGECGEGSNWEAILFASHHCLDNLVVIIDYNKIQSMGRVEDILKLEPFAEKLLAFGWETVEIDGHNHEEIYVACDNIPKTAKKPTCIIANTVKGKGVSFMENTVLWHYRSPQKEDFINAIQELEVAIL